MKKGGVGWLSRKITSQFGEDIYCCDNTYGKTVFGVMKYKDGKIYRYTNRKHIGLTKRIKYQKTTIRKISTS